MKAPFLSRTAWRTIGRRVVGAAALLPLILFAVSFPSAAEEQVQAAWKVREVDFFYRSSNAVYSCEALEGRVKSIFRAVGARDDLDVSARDCGQPIAPFHEPPNAWQAPSDRLRDRGTSRQQSAHVRIRAMLPIEVTPEVLADMKKDKGRRELISRVTGDSAAMFDDPVVFPARRQTITLSRASIGLAPEECELLDQLSASVFRRLDIRVVRRGYHCDPGSPSRIPPQLTVEALVGVPIGAPTVFDDDGDTDSSMHADPDPDPESIEPATATTPE